MLNYGVQAMKTNRYLIIRSIIIFWGSITMINGCGIKNGPVCTQNSIQYGVVNGIFRENPDDYYERGISYIQGGCYHAALDDFKEAIKKEPDDQRMYNTYGMHFLNYFPHRESGMLYYFLKDFDAARKHLKISIEKTPSLKAFYYLDQIRKEMILREQRPASIPEILLHQPENDIWTNQTHLIISGKAKDDQYISSLKIGPKSVFFKGSQQTLEFKEELSFDPGTYTIDIIATNLMETSKTHTLTIHVDKTGPQITIDHLQKGQTLKGWVSDDSGEISFFINNQKIFRSHKKDMPFQCIRNRDLHLKAIDKAGNITEMIIPQNYHVKHFHKYVASKESLYASDMYPSVNISESHSVIQLELNTLPEISYQQAIQLKGKVSAHQKIVQLTVDDQSILHHPGQIIQINHCVLLKNGENTVKIMASDSSGNAQIKHLKIIYQKPEVYQLHNRLGLSAYPFDLGQDVQGLFSRLFFWKSVSVTDKHATFLSYFIQDLQQKKRFQLRLRKKLMQIFKNSTEHLVSIQEPEKEFPSQLMIQGNIFDSNTGIEITAMVINVQTSKIITVIDVFDPESTKAILNQLADNLSLQLHEQFPIAEGMIKKIHPDGFDVSLSKGKIANNQWFYVCKPRTINLHLGTDLDIIGKGVVKGQLDNGFEGKLSGNRMVEIGDVIVGM